MTQDERWQAKYNEVMDFMEINRSKIIKTRHDGLWQIIEKK
jgi:hypothetical protein